MGVLAATAAFTKWAAGVAAAFGIAAAGGASLQTFLNLQKQANQHFDRSSNAAALELRWNALAAGEKEPTKPELPR